MGSGCGGYQRSFVGGIITGIGAQDLLSPCEWVLETDVGKGIRINITVSNYTIVMECIRKGLLSKAMTGSACDVDYLEVRIGSSSDGQLVGKYCGPSGADLVEVQANTVWVKWGKSETSSSISAIWSSYENDGITYSLIKNCNLK